jgi:hypothetical protein
VTRVKIKNHACLFLYFIPFIYISIYLDYKFQTILGYIFALISMSVLAYFNTTKSSLIGVIFGNFVSAAISYYLVSSIQNDNWLYFFKIFTPQNWVIVLSCINFIPQFIAILVAKTIKF